MTATSLDCSAAWIGRRGFKLLHTSGAIYIWISFFTAFLTRALHVSAGYWLPVALLSALRALRLSAAARKFRAAAPRDRAQATIPVHDPRETS